MIALVLLGCAAPLGVEGEAREKAGQAGDWQAGDAIEGWEDYDCGLSEGAGVAKVYYPTLAFAFFVFSRQEDREFIELDFLDADCDEFECVNNYPYNSPRVEVRADDPERGFAGMTGWYRDSGRDDGPYVRGSGSGPLGGFSPEVNRVPPTVEVCISRLRPDMIRGVIGVRYDNQMLAHQYVDTVQLYYPFEYHYIPHCAIDYSRDLAGMVVPEGCESAQSIGYGPYESCNYDDVWDWDAIVDPAVRDALYTQYTPANWE